MFTLSEKDTTEQFLLRRATQTGVPVTGSFELTPLCNLNCKMCYVRLKRTEQEKQGRLRTTKEWLEIAEQLKNMGTLFLLLTGGEPLLYPEFKEVYLGVQKLGMIVTVNTNGTLINERWADFFKENPPRRVNITLYGASCETYQNLCGDANGFTKALRGIDLLLSRGVPVKVGVSVVKQNRNDLQKLFQITRERGLILEPDTCMMSSANGQNDARLSPEDAARKSAEATLYKLGRENFYAYAENTVRAIERGECLKPQVNMRCLAGRCSFSVGWQGDLRPCVMLGACAVPIEKYNVQSAWNEIREKVSSIKQNETCITCKLHPLCRACPAMALRENGAFGTVPEYVCTYAKELYRLLCAESTAPKISEKGETVPHAQAL